MEPRIQYATTSDGVSIALWSIGEGFPIVNPPPALPWSHIELEWQIPEWRHWYEHLTENYQIVRYDNRGSGLSSRTVNEFSLESHVRDLEAVVDRLALKKFALFGLYFNAPAAIAYAVRHPERVSHLILFCALSKVSDADRASGPQEALDRLRDIDYEIFTETLAHTVFGWAEGDAAHRVAVYMRESLSAEQASAYWESSQEIDVTDLLPKVTQPTLILHRRDFPMLSVEVAKNLAANIPNARLKILEGASLSPYMGDMRAVLDSIDEFVGVDAGRAKPVQKAHAHEPSSQPHGASSAPVSAGFRTIMFTDMEGSTALTQRLGDAEAQSLVRLHNAIVGEALASHGGSQVKHTGDGIMASFLTASAAVECAITIQRAFARHNESNPREQIMVRIGINAGEPVAEGDDLFGTAVQLAARVCARADAGEVLSSDVVRQLVAGKGFLFADRGEADLRGFEDPVRVYEVRWREPEA
jgi:class 3 adenylate cyclase/pimeloyl-ACP methyl ester carboxylesterase